MGWTSLPIFCPGCARQGRRERLTDVELLPHTGGHRCRRCDGVLWLLVVANLRMAFVAEVSATDLREWGRAGLTVEDIMLAIGAPMLPRPAERVA